jgi:hypothetical protein
MTPQPKKMEALNNTLHLFVVEHGEYSDYQIDAIFSTRELAQAWIEKHPTRDRGYFSINDGFVLDDEIDARLVTQYRCHIDLESGDIFSESSFQEVRSDQWRGGVTVDPGRTVKDFDPVTGNRIFVTACQVASTVSMEHCHKLAAEARQAWLREKRVSK